MPQFEPKMIRDSNPDFRINPDPDVCRICPKMFWCIILSASVISPSMINTNKCPKISYSAMVKKGKWPGIHTRIRITTKIWSFLEGNFLPVPANCHVWSTSVSAFVSYPVYRMTKRQTERSQCHNLRLVGGGTMCTQAHLQLTKWDQSQTHCHVKQRAWIGLNCKIWSMPRYYGVGDMHLKRTDLTTITARRQ